MSVRCFWLEPTGRARLSLRRYGRSHGDCAAMVGPNGYHDASVPLFDVYEPKVPTGDPGPHTWTYRHGGPHTREDVEALRATTPQLAAWPTVCACGYVFAEDDHWQVFTEHLYRRADTGELVTLRAAPPGAMWDAEWMHDCRGGYFLGGPNTDGRFLMVKCPNGHDWAIDSRASNCTLPHDDTHRCWVRHGEPPHITVDKSGATCQAGAGSIQAGDYHGFLKNGEFS